LLTFLGEAKTTKRSAVAAKANSRSELSAPTWRAAIAKKALCRRATPGIIALTAMLALAGCGSTPKRADTSKAPATQTSKSGAYYLDDGPGDNPPANLDAIPNAVPKAEPLHRGANRPYTIFGKTYVPNVSNEPFRQQGIASWYGRKYHGQMTSIGETYDMYGMTAAHPTLPLPSYVRVTNPANMKSVVVRLNDRGPFHADRVIDLSYTAAAKLDIAKKGSGMVWVERVFPGDASKAAAAPPAVVAAPSPVPAATAIVTSPIIPDSGEVYLQLAAFSSLENAEIFRDRMTRELDWNREPIQVIQKDNLFRVRMGPYKSREEAEAIAAQVKQSHDFAAVIQKP
jgi:rare lipoprotein A